MDFPHSLLVNVHLMKRQFDKAISEAKRAVLLNPNGADAHAHLGTTLHYAGQTNEAISFFKRAIRLNPIPPNYYVFVLAEANFMSGAYEEAISAYQSVLSRNPDDVRSLYGLTATYSLLGQKDLAKAQAKEVLRVAPKFSLRSFGETLPFRNAADKELLFEALRNAGLPEQPEHRHLPIHLFAPGSNVFSRSAPICCDGPDIPLAGVSPDAYLDNTKATFRIPPPGLRRNPLWQG